MYASTLTADMSAVGAVACTADMSAPQQGRRRRRHCERGFGTVTVVKVIGDWRRKKDVVQYKYLI
jgi:hypothetical protein